MNADLAVSPAFDCDKAQSAGLRAAIADNPDCAGLLRALASLPDEPAVAAASPIAPRVVATIAANERRRRFLYRALFATSSAAAAAAAAVIIGVSSAAESPTTPTGSGDMSAANAHRETIATASTSLPADIDAIVSSQRPDGSWSPTHGGEALAPAATGLAVLRLATSPNRSDPLADKSLKRAVAWLRASQNPDGSFGRASGKGLAAPNLALPAVALLRLYETGDWPELFTPADAAVTAVRSHLSEISDTPRESDIWLAAALSLADRLEWPDESTGDLHRAVRRLASAENGALSAVSSARTMPEARAAIDRAIASAIL